MNKGQEFLFRISLLGFSILAIHIRFYDILYQY
jgi:hypothetical protein